MPSVAEYRVVIPLPRAAAWEKLSDLTLAHNYVPGLVRTEICSFAATGIGASRRVYRTETSWLQETVTEWREGHGFTIRLHLGEQAPPPFREATFRYWLDDAPGGHTQLTTTLSYTPRWGALGALLDRLALARGIRGMVRDVALSLKDFYMTGVPVTRARLTQLRLDASSASA
jgi:hypothetical protein